MKRVFADYPYKEDEESCSSLNLDSYEKEGVHLLAQKRIKWRNRESYEIADLVPLINNEPIIKDNFEGLSPKKKL